MSSYNLGKLTSYFRFHMPPIFVEFPLSNVGAFLLSGITVVASGSFVESFWIGKYFKVLI